MLATESPFPQYFELNGSPLDAGKLYFGLPNQNPETAPIQVYWDFGGTQPAAQPIRTLNGYAVRSGTPANVFVAGDYSISVRSSSDRLLYYAPNSAEFSFAAAIQAVRDDLANTTDTSKGDALIGVQQPFPGATPTTQHAVNARTFNVFDYMTQEQIADVVARTRAIDVTVPIQQAINAAASVGGAVVHLPCGSYKITSALLINAENITISGANNPGTILWQYTLNSKIFIITDKYSRIEHLAMDYSGAAALDGATALHYEGGGFSSLGDIIVFKSWIAVDVSNLVGLFMHDIHLRNHEFIGIHAHDNAFEIHCHRVIMDAGDQVKGQLGNLRLGPGTVEAFFMISADLINGAFSMTTSSSNVLRERPAAIEFTNALFDTSDGGVFLDEVADIDFVGCWFSNCNQDNIRIVEVDSIRFIGGRSISSRFSGASLSPLAKNVSFIDFTVRDNSLGSPGIHPGLILFDGSDGVRVIGGQYGGTDFYTTTAEQDYGIDIRAGCNNYLVDGADVRNNAVGGILDAALSSTGVITNCTGYKTKDAGIATINVGAASVVVNHGVNATPSAANIVLTYGSSPAASGVANIFPSSPTATTFQINTNVAVVGAPLQIGWQVRVKGA